MNTPFVDKKTWLAARLDLLKKEKALTQARDELSSERRKLPFVQITKDYCFDTIRGQERLPSLFKERSQLIVYHFMFGQSWEEGCPSCSFWMDNLDGIEAHLAARDTAFVVISTASLETLLAYKQRMGWQFDWVSSGRSDFNQDFGVTFPEGADDSNRYNYTSQTFGEEMPGMSVFKRFDDNTIGHTYSTYARGLDSLNGTYQLLDLTSNGRDEGELPYPMAWVHRKDQYPEE